MLNVGCAADIYSRETLFTRNVCRLHGTSAALSTVKIFNVNFVVLRSAYEDE